jgi:hypothetical protein
MLVYVPKTDACLLEPNKSYPKNVNVIGENITVSPNTWWELEIVCHFWCELGGSLS